jgi:hypothetical protein
MPGKGQKNLRNHRRSPDIISDSNHGSVKVIFGSRGASSASMVESAADPSVH